MNNTESKEYLDFMKKFEVKKTTDDCYTPPEVYDVVLNYVKEHCDIEGKRIMRPFYPGGDYKNEDYTDAVVVDNPPFSILAKIVRFYNARKIPFFLFAPNVTTISPIKGIDTITAIISNADIVYENKARITTNFLTNLMGDKRVVIAKSIRDKVDDINKYTKRNSRIKYNYPINIVTSSSLNKVMDYLPVDFCISAQEVSYVRQLDQQEKKGKTIFGCGLIVSDRVANILQDALELKRHEEEVTWELSDREKDIIEKLNQNTQK